MQYVIPIFMTIASFFKKNSKYLPKLLLISMIPVFVLFRGSQDLYYYEVIYNDFILGSDLSFGFRILLEVSGSIGLSFTAFIVLCDLTSVILIYWSIKLCTNNVMLPFALFAIFPLFFGSIGQVRNLLATSIVLLALSLAMNSKRFLLLKLSFGILLAYSIHASSLFYIVLLLAFINIRIIELYITVIMSSFSLYFLISSKFLYNIYSNILTNERITQWLFINERTNFINFFIPAVSQIGCLVLMHYACKRISEQHTSLNHNTMKRAIRKDSFLLYPERIKTVYRMNVILLCILPFYLISPSYFRLFQYFIIFDYIVLAEAFIYIRKRMQKKNDMPLYNVILILYVLFVAVMYWYCQNHA